MASTQETRYSTFNVSLNRDTEGQLIEDLSTSDNGQAQTVAEIIQRVNPDILLLNEFDFDPEGKAARLFQENYLSVSQNGTDPVEYPFRFIAPSNTGIASGFDLDNNGSVVTTPNADGYGNDALGFGQFPGQFAMAFFSKYPIVEADVRTFQNFLWQDMPGALLPDNPDTLKPQDFYSPEELEAFRLSSKSHWDIPIEVNGEIVHVLASHPTPPVFDGPEDRNGRRNFDEIRFWADYVTPGQGDYIYDDAGNFGGLSPDANFVIMGDQNADPFDGDSIPGAIQQLLDNPRINTSVTPDSEGGLDAAERQGGANETHETDPAFDTADFQDIPGPGNLRADYVLPAQDLGITEASVFWPTDEDPLFPLVGDFPFPSSDHRLVRADVVAEPIAPDSSQRTVANVDSLGEVIFDTGYIFDSTVVGGLSGITYDPFNKLYYSISDDRSEINPARFYTLDINLSDGSLDNGDITFQGVTTLTDANDSPFASGSLDPEGIALTNRGTLFISSEGDASQFINPFINQFSLAGEQFQELPVPEKFLPTEDGTSGIRNNLAFESLAITPDQRFLYTATENALAQDGPAADLENDSPSRILKYNLATGEPEQEFLYLTDPVPAAPDPATGFSTNGLVELLALDNSGTLLGLERSFSEGVGNSIRLYEVKLQGATDISGFDSLEGLEVDAPAQKRLLFDFADLDLPLDNIEGMTFGPTLEDGRQSLIVVSDNNFSVGDPNDPSDNQFTQFLTFALDTDTINPTPASLINGVASGDTTQTSTVLWTRSNFRGDVTFEYSTEADFSTSLGTKTRRVTNINRPVKVAISGLTPGTEYFYRATDAAGATATGQFETATALGTQAGLRFGVTGDWRGELSPYPAIANADERDLDFLVEHGDTIYADFPSPAVPEPQATTLEELRAKHNEVYSPRFGLNTWEDLRASTSILATIDDHEVTNDFQGGEDLATADADAQNLFGATSGLVNDSPLYENGLQVFQEYNPIQDHFYGETGDPRTANERQLYRFNTYGSDAAAFILDARSFRDPGLPPVTDLDDPAQVSEFITSSFDPTRTLLGEQQLLDLQQDLLQAQQDGITWKFIHLPEPIQNLGPLAASDRYEGYAAERTELLQFINDNNIDNVVFVAADIHGTLVNNLTYQEAPAGPQIATGAFEVTTGAVAFDPPFGPTLIDVATDLGLINAEQRALYDSLPREGQDQFLQGLINDGLEPFGYDPLGLQESEINATLTQGDYIATQTYGWTEFEIDAETQKLTVTTYGIEPYSEAELLADPRAINERTPTVASQFEVRPALSGKGGSNTFVIRQGNATEVITNFGGVGTGTDLSPIILAEVDTLQFEGEGLTAENLLLTQEGSNLAIEFEGIQDTQVVLKDFVLEDLDNLQQSRGASRDISNILFNGQTAIADSLDIFDADQQREQVFNSNTVTFLNDLDNNVRGFKDSDDVINGQGGDDRLSGLSGDDILRGGDGDDTLAGGAGKDQFWITSNGILEGADTITDFQNSSDLIGLSGGLTFDQLSIGQGIGADANNTLIRLTSSNELLANLIEVQSSTITAADFLTV